MICLSIFPLPFSLLLRWHILLVAESKNQNQPCSTAWPLAEGRKSMKDRCEWRSATTRNPACVPTRGSWTSSQQINLHWLGEQERLLHKRHGYHFLCWIFNCKTLEITEFPISTQDLNPAGSGVLRTVTWVKPSHMALFLPRPTALTSRAISHHLRIGRYLHLLLQVGQWQNHNSKCLNLGLFGQRGSQIHAFILQQSLNICCVLVLDVKMRKT